MIARRLPSTSPVRISAIFFAAALLLAIASCGKVETSTIPFDSVVDQNIQTPVLDSSRHVVWGAISQAKSATYLEGVAISGSGAAATTDASGTYKIYLPAGSQTLTFSKEGYVAESKDVSGHAGTATELNVALAVVGSTGGSGGSGGSGSGGGSGGTGGTGGTGSGGGYVVTAGKNVERRLKVPCSVEFRITGKLPSVEDGSSRDGEHLAWAYDRDFGGGNTTAGGGMVVGVRDYGIKVYHSDGTYAGMVRYSVDWNRSRTYLVKLAIDSRKVAFYVDGARVAEIDATAPDQLTVGYGWPPSGRPGPEGAVITDVVWSE